MCVCVCVCVCGTQLHLLCVVSLLVSTGPHLTSFSSCVDLLWRLNRQHEHAARLARPRAFGHCHILDSSDVGAFSRVWPHRLNSSSRWQTAQKFAAVNFRHFVLVRVVSTERTIAGCFFELTSDGCQSSASRVSRSRRPSFHALTSALCHLTHHSIFLVFELLSKIQ